MKRLGLGLIIVLSACVGGCGKFWEDPYITVTTTPLNWIEIHYYNVNRKPIRRTSVRITGSGLVEVRSGTSRRVSDSFAKDMKEANWEDIREGRLQVDPEHVRVVFQELVDAGLFDKEKTFRETRYPSDGRCVAVRAAMDNRTYSEPENICETDPELAERLINVVHEFNRPVLRKRRKPINTEKAARKADKKDAESEK